MAKIDLVNGAYVGRSIIANDQRCINLFLESAPGDSPFPTTHYPAPGLVRLTTASTSGWRCLYAVKSTGDLYGVCGATVYYISPAWVLTAIGTIGTSAGIVSMADNGFEVLIVDGSASGYMIAITTKVFAAVTDPAFYGATRVDVADTYLIANRIGTQNYYISKTNQAAWNPLDIAAKTGSPDNLVVAIVLRNEIWLLGQKSGEVHYDTGAPDFPYARMPGVFLEHGCMAPYSVAKYDQSIYWLSQNAEGQAIIMRGNQYTAERISTHAIEAEMGKYSALTDAIGSCFQIGGHAFYQITFPSGDATWVFDEATKMFHQRASIDGDGAMHRHRANCIATAYGKTICGDYADGRLYQMSLDVYTEDGAPILYLRTFPHMIADGNRVTYKRFIADMEVGNTAGLLTTDSAPMASLRWSDDRGASFGDAVMMPLGTTGQYSTSLQWWGLGMARDRVFELSWSAPIKTALNGAFVEIEAHET